MDSFTDFMTAALPWIAMGLFLVVFFARAAHSKKGKKKTMAPRGYRWGCASALPWERRYISISVSA